MPLFVNNFASANKFDVIYDFGNMKLTGIDGQISVQVSDDLNWTGNLILEQYKPAAETESWYKPQARLNSNLRYNFNKQLSFDAAVALQGQSKAKIYTSSPASPYILPNPAIERVVNVKGFVDLGVGADYKINNKFSAFARATNLLNTNYSKYLYYRTNGFSIFGGLSYSF